MEDDADCIRSDSLMYRCIRGFKGESPFQKVEIIYCILVILFLRSHIHGLPFCVA